MHNTLKYNLYFSPIAPFSDDSSDLSMTPDHFLIGRLFPYRKSQLDIDVIEPTVAMAVHTSHTGTDLALLVERLFARTNSK